jgi:hypothetical protein
MRAVSEILESDVCESHKHLQKATAASSILSQETIESKVRELQPAAGAWGSYVF